MSKIIDICSYNGEHDLFEIRYNILKDYVDEFIVVEFDKTFSGKPKEKLFNQHWDKVKYFFIGEEQYNKYMDLALSSPNTKGASHWVREFCQKESIKDCLTHLKDDDIVFIGDCDEIWNPEMNPREYYDWYAKKLRLNVYSYYLNNKSNEIFYGTICIQYAYIKEYPSLNEMRSGKYELQHTDFLPGWHFTSLKDGLERKLTDSYTEESYATPQVLTNLKDNIENNRDFLGRDFKYEVDESQWPEYLKDNREKYLHLLK